MLNQDDVINLHRSIIPSKTDAVTKHFPTKARTRCIWYKVVPDFQRIQCS